MMADTPQLVVIKGPKVGRTFHLDEPTLVIGRHPQSGIVIDHPEVSRRHARVLRQEEGWIVEDLDSTNGTFVNGARLSGPHELSPGDRVGLSEAVTLTFRQEPAVPAGARSEEASRPAPPSMPPRQPAPARSPTWDHREQPEAPRSYRAASPEPATQAERGPDRTLLLIGAGCIVLLLIAVCAGLLLLSYMDVIPSLFGSVPAGPGLAPPAGL